MEISKRALRRHHLERLKKKRQYHFWSETKLTGKNLYLAISAPKPCSCYMCGNPRKHFKEKTRQEYQNFDKWKVEKLENNI